MDSIGGMVMRPSDLEAPRTALTLSTSQTPQLQPSSDFCPLTADRWSGAAARTSSFPPLAFRSYIDLMSAAEIMKELPKLTEAERRAVLNKLRELSQMDDEQWEQILNDPRPRPKLESFVRESAEEGESPLDPNRL